MRNIFDYHNIILTITPFDCNIFNALGQISRIMSYSNIETINLFKNNFDYVNIKLLYPDNKLYDHQYYNDITYSFRSIDTFLNNGKYVDIIYDAL